MSLEQSLEIEPAAHDFHLYDSYGAAPPGFFDWVVAAGVGIYLGGVMLYLVASRKIDPGVSLGWLVRASLRPRVRGTLAGFVPEHGHCYKVSVTPDLVCDSKGHSRIQILEDGALLGPAHSLHADVRVLGGGRYSHWKSEIYFSTSDNSDPRTNGRVYTYCE